MRPESIEEKKVRRKKSAARGVLLFGLVQLASAACFLSLCFIPGLPGWCVILFGALAAACVLLMIPALLALRERYKEIEGGDLDAASEY